MSQDVGKLTCPVLRGLEGGNAPRLLDGKTQIAVEFAYQHRNDYEAVLWVLSDTRESLVSGYIALAKLLNLAEKNEQDQAVIVNAVKNWLQTHDSWLLILDNADDLAIVYEFLPPTFGGHLLLTTRAQATGTRADRIEVETMLVDVGTLFLLRRAKLIGHNEPLDGANPADIVVARSITEELGGLPLALDQAGAYIEEVQCSLSGYLERYLEERAVLLERRGGIVADHPEPVATTWSLSFQKVEEQSPEAANLLRLCAFLHPDTVPEEMLIRSAARIGTGKEKKTKGWLSGLTSLLVKRQGSVAGKQKRFVLDECIRVLSAYSLMRRNPSDQTLSIHRLVQTVLRDTMDKPTRKQWVERAIKSVNAVFPGVEFEMWPQCERYLPHALVCAELVEQRQVESLEAARLLNQAGWYLKERARYSEAEPLILQGLAIRQHRLKPMHTDIALSLSTLGSLYYAQGRLAETEPVWQQALTIYAQQLGADHPETATSLDNLAELYRAQGKLDQAEPLHQRALHIWKQQLGADHPKTATSLNNLAGLYWRQGKYQEAEPLLKRALSINEKVYEPEHPSVANSLNNLAALYSDQGKYEQAEPLFRRALAICEQQLGADHPKTATSLNNLAALYKTQGKYEQAESLYQRALEINEQQLGANHPETATNLNNLAALYRAQGKYEQAGPLFQRALAIREQALGEAHPDTAMTVWWLAVVHEEQRQNEKAEPFYRRAFSIYKQTLGLEHPSTQSMQRHYVQLLRKTGRDNEATTLETTGQLPSDEH